MKTEVVVAATYSGKRLLDLIVSVTALLALCPVFLLISLLIFFLYGRPIFFIQERAGLHGRPFAMWKFRSMTGAKDAAGNMLSASKRVTRLGKLLRLTSLDELPELLNVIRGEMSVVGPRPLLVDYLNYYSDQQMRRHDARPGITGWAQVNGRNNLSWEEKFAYDVWYVENVSLGLDLLILSSTAVSVILMRNINKDGRGHEGADYFRGSSSRRRG